MIPWSFQLVQTGPDDQHHEVKYTDYCYQSFQFIFKLPHIKYLHLTIYFICFQACQCCCQLFGPSSSNEKAWTNTMQPVFGPDCHASMCSLTRVYVHWASCVETHKKTGWVYFFSSPKTAWCLAKNHITYQGINALSVWKNMLNCIFSHFLQVFTCFVHIISPPFLSFVFHTLFFQIGKD